MNIDKIKIYKVCVSLFMIKFSETLCSGTTSIDWSRCGRGNTSGCKYLKKGYICSFEQILVLKFWDVFTEPSEPRFEEDHRFVGSWKWKDDVPPSNCSLWKVTFGISWKDGFLAELQFKFVDDTPGQTLNKYEDFIVPCSSSRVSPKILAHRLVSKLHDKSSFWRSWNNGILTMHRQSDHFHPGFGLVDSYGGCNEMVSKTKGWNVVNQWNGDFELVKSL